MDEITTYYKELSNVFEKQVSELSDFVEDLIAESNLNDIERNEVLGKLYSFRQKQLKELDRFIETK